MNAARIFNIVGHVAWVVFGAWAEIAGSRKGPVVGVLYPAVFGIKKRNRLLQSMQSLPFGCRIAAV